MAHTLITGAAGMVGSHLVEYLSTRSTVLGSIFRPTVRVEELANCGAALISLDVCDEMAVRNCIGTYQPAIIYHLAAQSLPTVSWKAPWETLKTNVQGTVNIFEAIKSVRTDDSAYDPMVVVACSSAEYGASLTPERVPITEDELLLPLHPYGVSKVAQDLLSYQYWANDGIRCIRARIFNTTGPRKTSDVVSDFAKRIVATSRSSGKLPVGNLKAQRAILDVSDLIRALVLLAERGEPGEAYNICGERAFPIFNLIPIFERLAGRTLPYEQDDSLLRPTDESVILGSSAKIREAVGWEPEVSIDDTVRRVYEYECKWAALNS